jgi:galactofuranose transport system substrate-binding protein
MNGGSGRIGTQIDTGGRMKKGILAVLALGALSVTLTATGQARLPKLAKKDTYKVGFAQVESNNPWRLAQTKSMQDEAKARGY